MKSYFLLSIGLLFSFLTAQSQNLHTSSNAASIENEANSTTGWTGTALITSSTTTPQNGTYSMLITTNGSGREARYTFNAVVGTVYNISIWARQGTPANNPAFANWTGFESFTTRVISSATWTQYNFTLTASATNPVIRVYSGPSGAASGTQVYIDAVSILASGGGGGTTDTQAPTAPTNLVASGTTSNSTNLSWNASTDNVGVTSYTIRRNNVVVGTVAGNTTSFAATGLAASTTYSFNVVASDAAGNVSGASNTVNVTTLAGGGSTDTQAPTAPSGLAASGTTSNSTNLSWNASTDNVGVTGYTIRRNNVAVGTVPGNTTSYIATSLSPSTTYSFNVVASDAAGNVSGTSNTVNVTTTAGDGGGGGGGTSGGSATTDFQARNLYVAGVLGIGTAPNSNFQLSVNGDIRAKEIVVESGWSDFVFDPDYYLPSLAEVEEHIKEKGHLKDIPSAAEVVENGVGLAEFNTRLLQKVEEMTLYLIQMDKQIRQLEVENELLKKAIENNQTENR